MAHGNPDHWNYNKEFTLRWHLGLRLQAISSGYNYTRGKKRREWKYNNNCFQSCWTDTDVLDGLVPNDCLVTGNHHVMYWEQWARCSDPIISTQKHPSTSVLKPLWSQSIAMLSDSMWYRLINSRAAKTCHLDPLCPISLYLALRVVTLIYKHFMCFQSICHIYIPVLVASLCRE